MKKFVKLLCYVLCLSAFNDAIAGKKGYYDQPDERDNNRYSGVGPGYGIQNDENVDLSKIVVLNLSEQANGLFRSAGSKYVQKHQPTTSSMTIEGIFDSVKSGFTEVEMQTFNSNGANNTKKIDILAGHITQIKDFKNYEELFEKVFTKIRSDLAVPGAELTESSRAITTAMDSLRPLFQYNIRGYEYLWIIPSRFCATTPIVNQDAINHGISGAKKILDSENGPEYAPAIIAFAQVLNAAGTLQEELQDKNCCCSCSVKFSTAAAFAAIGAGAAIIMNYVNRATTNQIVLLPNNSTFQCVGSPYPINLTESAASFDQAIANITAPVVNHSISGISPQCMSSWMLGDLQNAAAQKTGLLQVSGNDNNFFNMMLGIYGAYVSRCDFKSVTTGMTNLLTNLTDLAGMMLSGAFDHNATAAEPFNVSYSSYEGLFQATRRFAENVVQFSKPAIIAATPTVDPSGNLTKQGSCLYANALQVSLPSFCVLSPSFAGFSGVQDGVSLIDAATRCNVNYNYAKQMDNLVGKSLWETLLTQLSVYDSPQFVSSLLPMVAVEMFIGKIDDIAYQSHADYQAHNYAAVPAYAKDIFDRCPTINPNFNYQDLNHFNSMFTNMTANPAQFVQDVLEVEGVVNIINAMLHNGMMVADNWNGTNFVWPFAK